MDRPVVMFPGQGSQCAQMGRDLADKEREAMDLWKLAEKLSGLPLREIYWDGTEAQMNDTKALQPALVCTELNLWRHVSRKVQPMATCGHSLGEFSALACAKVLSPKDVLQVVSLRGSLMAQADPEGRGGMAAIVKLPVATVQSIVEHVSQETQELLILANFNAPLQTVISGMKRPLELACKEARSKKGRGMLLNVMMAEANNEFAQVLASVEWHDAVCPVYGNIDGLPESQGALLQKKMLKQMISPVLWLDTIKNQSKAGLTAWLEIGPKSLLNKMVTTILEQDEIVTAQVTDLKSLESFLAAEE